MAFNLPDLFPNLCTSVVAALDRADLDKLWVAQEQFAPGVLGENATKDFLLRHVFEVAAELITEPSDLLRVLLRRHYRSAQVPAILDKRLLVLLQQSGRFRNWPLDQIVPDRLAFFRFLQERWPAFVQRLAEKNDGVAEPSPGFAFEFDGPTELPFDHADVRAHVSNLFAEGLLRPIEGQITPRLGDHWALVGVSTDPARDAVLRMGKLLDALRETLPGPDARPSGVADLRPAIGALRLLEFEAPFETLTSLRSKLDETALTVDSAFQAWVLARYASLHSQPARPPVMVHHVARVLAFDREKTGAKVALVVIDGLSLDQWLSLRASLLARDQSLAFTDGAVFAWVPTLTSVSRQAIFAGRAPLYFPDSLLTTDREPQVWAQLWADQGLGSSNVAYLKGLGDTSSLATVGQLLSRPGIKAVGLVVDTVDRIMHGMELGSRGMHGQIRQWAEEGFLRDLFTLLLGQASLSTSPRTTGTSRLPVAVGHWRVRLPTFGASAARVYPNTSLRDLVAARFPGSTAWPGVGLPVGFHALLAPQGKAFIPADERAVAHGGTSIEELVVPFVRVERKPA